MMMTKELEGVLFRNSMEKEGMGRGGMKWE
jgi:hypothetical protein